MNQDGRKQAGTSPVVSKWSMQSYILTYYKFRNKEPQGSHEAVLNFYVCGTPQWVSKR